MLANELVGEQLLLAYRDLIGAEARLGETLARRGIRIGATLADQWSTLDEFLGIYGRGLSPAGVLVLAGRPDEGARLTGIPFTGAPEARERLGLDARGDARSPAGVAFWRAVDAARSHAPEAPMESVFGTVHLAHAQPFDFPPEPEVREASRQHVLRLLATTRPQAIVCVGAQALATVGQAVGQAAIVDLANAREATWPQRWPPGTRLSAHPYVELPAPRPYRARIVPVPSLEGPSAAAAERALAGVLSYALA